MNLSRVIQIGVASAADRPLSVWAFLRHLLEMTVAMMLGMCILGMDIPAAPPGGVRNRLR